MRGRHQRSARVQQRSAAAGAFTSMACHVSESCQKKFCGALSLVLSQLVCDGKGMSTEEDATARRLFDAGRATEPPLAPATRVTEPPSTAAHAVAAPDLDAETALHYLEAEWAMRMEAPLSALANLEQTVTRAIEHAHDSLPRVASDDD